MVTRGIPDPSLEKAEPNHIRALDGLRGLAILLVLFRHLGFEAGKNQTWWIRVLADITDSGFIGVDLFFVLSGFLITGILYKTLNDSHYFKKFYMRRFLRIFPLYYGYLSILFGLSRPLRIAWHGMAQVFLAYAQNIFLVRPYTTLWYYTGQLWSLAVEEQFYILWPLLVFLIRDRRRLMGVTITLSILALVLRVLLTSSGVSGELIYTLTPCRMDSLLIGSWIALAWRGPARTWILKAARPLCIACGSSYFALLMVNEYISSWQIGYVFSTVSYSVVAIGFASLLVMALKPQSATSNLCQLPLLRWLGKYSYGIYVIHLAVLHVVNGTVRRWVPLSGPLARMHLMSYIVYIPSIGISLALAWLSYNFYEVHFLRLKIYFSYDRPVARHQLAANG